MSATELAALIVSTVVAALLAGLAAWLVFRARNTGNAEGVGVAAFCLGLLAVIVFGVGAATANGGEQHEPAPGSRCQDGTYDNGAPSGGQPYCVQWQVNR